MRVGIWGAGTIGTGLAYRLSMSPHVSELYWTNRTFETIRSRCIDLRQGLAFAPTCHTIEEIPMLMAREKLLPNVDLLIVTAGKSVSTDSTRETVFKENFDLFSISILPQLVDLKGSY